MKRTKIVCTLGPASSKAQVIEKLIMSGMNVARINFSHGTHQEHKEKIDAFNEAREKTGIPAALMMDTKGPEIRLGVFENHKIILKNGQKFILSMDDRIGDNKAVSVSYKNLYAEVTAGDTVLINDGKVSMTVDKVMDRDVICRVVNGGEISDKKGVNVPGVKLDMEYLSDADKSDIIFGVQNDVDFVAASFIRRADDIRALRTFLDSRGGKRIKIISKIENKEGLENFEEILELSDGIMVARGDMGVEIGLENIPSIQKRIITRCCSRGKIAITATQMLESMIENPVPTRAEVADVANAVYDRTSAVMLSGETAVGGYPVEAVETMSKIVEKAEEDAVYFGIYDEYNKIRIDDDTKSDPSNAVGHASCQAARDLGAGLILAITTSGYTSEKISKYKPEIPIIAATPHMKTYYQQALVWGVYPILTKESSDLDEVIDEAVNIIKKKGMLASPEWIVISAGLPMLQSGNTNLMKIEKV